MTPAVIARAFVPASTVTLSIPTDAGALKRRESKGGERGYGRSAQPTREKPL